jgi:hypothetical protein
MPLLPHTAKLGFSLAWLVVCTAVVGPAHAQGALPVAETEPPLSPETYQLAARPLELPRTEIALGALLLTAVPVMYTIAGMETLDFTSCEDDLFGTSQVDPQCEEEERLQAENDDRLLRNVGIASAVLGVLGVGLLADGIVRTVRIHKARTKVARFQHAAISPTRHGVALSISVSF